MRCLAWLCLLQRSCHQVCGEDIFTLVLDTCKETSKRKPPGARKPWAHVGKLAFCTCFQITFNDLLQSILMTWVGQSLGVLARNNTSSMRRYSNMRLCPASAHLPASNFCHCLPYCRGQGGGHSKTLHLSCCGSIHSLNAPDAFGRPVAQSPKKSRLKCPAIQDSHGDAEAAGTHEDPGSELAFAKQVKIRWSKKFKRLPEEDLDLSALGCFVLHEFCLSTILSFVVLLHHS